MGLLLYLASIRVAILTRLWLNTPWPHQTRAPWSPSIWLLFHPKSLLRQLIRPSLPVLHFTNRWNAGFCSMARCDALGLPLVGRTTVLTPMSLGRLSRRRLRILDRRSRHWGPCRPLSDAFDGGSQHG